MAAPNSGMPNSLPQAMYSPLTSNALHGQSSLNSALKNASEAAESRQAEDEEEGRTSDLHEAAEEVAEAERADEEQNPSHLNGGESKAVNGSTVHLNHGGIESGLSSQWSRVDSEPLGNIFEGDETASCSDSEPFEASELELIEAALTSLRSVEGETEGSEAAEQKNSSSNDQQDMQDVARLLKKVQAVKARKREAPLEQTRPSLGGSFRQGGSPGGEGMEPADIRRVVQAAAETALAAAKTAETVVSSLNRNSQAMEALCKVLTSSDSVHLPVEDTAEEVEHEDEDTEGSNDAKFLAIELQQTEIAKSLVRQNRVTHWVLGFIVVSSLVWRYGVIKFVKKINNTIQNPFQGITDMFFKSPENKEDSENDDSGPQFKLPGILTGEDQAEQQKRPVRQEKEEGMFNIGSIFPTEKPEASKQGKRRAKHAKEDGKLT